MTQADILCFVVLIAATTLGLVCGTLRALVAVVGASFAFTAANQVLLADGERWHYLGVFFGVLALGAIGGQLLYGATRWHPIESMEGAFGAIGGFVVGVIVSRVLLIYFWNYFPDSAIVASLPGSMIAYDIYTLRPLLIFWNDPNVRELRNPTQI